MTAANMEQALYSILSDDTAVKALVAARIYPSIIPPDAALPAIAYQRVSAMRVKSHGGPSSLARPRFQITCLARSYGSARAVADATRGALDGIKKTVGNVWVQAAFVQNEFDTFTVEDDLYTVRQDFYVWHAETW